MSSHFFLKMSFINYIAFEVKITLAVLLLSNVVSFFVMILYHLFSFYFFIWTTLILPNHFLIFGFLGNLTKFIISYFLFVMYTFRAINISQDSLLLLYFPFKSYKN